MAIGACVGAFVGPLVTAVFLVAMTPTTSHWLLQLEEGRATAAYMYTLLIGAVIGGAVGWNSSEDMERVSHVEGST